MSFFDRLPRPAGPPDDDRPDPPTPEWFGAPKDVMGGVTPLAETVVRTEQVFIGLRAVTAYPTGLSLGLVLAARRGSLTRERWQDVEVSFWGESAFHRSSGSGDGMLRLGVELAHGSRTSTLQHGDWRPDVPPRPPVLLRHGGGGSGGSRTMEQDVDLWLWPLPAGDELSLVLQWPDLDVHETAHRIDLAPVRAAAARAMPFWS